MSGAGRPLRFLAIVLGGWTAMRTAMLWPSIERPTDIIDAVVPRFAAAPQPPAPIAQRTAGHPRPRTIAVLAAPQSVPPLTFGRHHPPAPDPRRVALASFMLLRFGTVDAVSVRQPGPASALAGSLPLAPRPASGSRWSGSGWLVLRGDGAAGAAFGGSQLGASQAGLRLAYTIDRTRRLALAGRVTTPLHGKGREIAIGVEWQPTHAPVRVVAEQRLALDGGKSAPALGVIGGIGPAPLARGVTVEAYAQAGAILRDGVETFADGAARVAHPIATLGKTRFDLGAGAWGAAQRGAARLDAGPSLSADLPLGDRAHVRLALDWRWQLAGDAQPRSGLVLSLGTDF